MKNFFNLKALVFSVVLVIFALPLSAQWNDNFFQIEDNDDAFYLDRGTFITIGGAGITPQGIGEAPLGSGLLVLMAAGAGYAVSRRRRSLRKGTMLLLAFAMLLGFTQCRKKLDTISDVTTGKVHITLRVEKDSRIVVDTLNAATNGYAAVSFENGDVMYVGYNKTYVGSLTYDGADFNGDINIAETVEDEPLYFYFLGGKGFTPTFDGNVATLNISNQTSKYPVINFAHSAEVYPSSTGNYTARLLNKCAIVKFKVNKVASSDGTCITGMNNLVTVDFDHTKAGTDEGFTFSKVNGGVITIPSKAGEVWAILLPQAQVTDAYAYSKNCATQNRFTVPEIEANQYSPSGIALNLQDTYISASSTTKVLFAPGNLQYLGNANGTGTWRFAEHQYDFMGDGPSSGTSYQGNVTVSGFTKYNASADLDVARDLFGWGASGYNNKYPYMTTTTINEYYNGSLVDENANYDWGVYHSASGSSTEKITNGGSYSWRLLTYDEWSYVINRTNKVYTKEWPDSYKQTKNLFCDATITGVMTNNVKGVIIFPNSWNGDFYRNIKYGNESGCTFNSNVFNADQWAMLENMGCVFLPVAHVRNGTSMTYLNEGHYWTSTLRNAQEGRGTSLDMLSGGTVYVTTNLRRFGQSVRLIYNVE